MSTQQRTLEQRVKFDHGLSIGTNLVDFTVDTKSRRAIVSISPRGLVRYLVKPNPSDMYSSWDRLRGDMSVADKGVIVWGARNPEIMQMFEGEPVASIPVV